MNTTHEEECKVEVRERSPGKQQLNGVVYEFDLCAFSHFLMRLHCGELLIPHLQDDLPEEVLARSPDPEPEDRGMHGGEQ